MRNVLIGALLVLVLTSSAFGQTNSTWNGGTGDWSVISDWSPSGVPNNAGSTTFSVGISALNSAVNLDLLNVTVDNLTLAAANSLTISTGYSLSLVSGTSANSGAILNNGTIAILPPLNLPGSAAFNNYGTISGSGVIRVGPVSDLGTYSATFNNYGTISGGIDNLGRTGNFGMFYSVGFDNFGYFTNSGVLKNTGTIINQPDGYFSNSGVIHNTGTFTNWTSLTNSGTIYNASGATINNVDGPFSSISNTGTIINAGTINNIGVVGGGTVDNLAGGVISSNFAWQSDSLKNAGTITALGGGKGPAGIVDLSVGMLTNTGTIQSDGSLARFSVGTLINRGTVEATDGGTLIVGGGASKKGIIQATGVGSAVLLKNGTTVTGGTLSGTSGGIIETVDTATLKGVTNSGSYVMTDGSTTSLSGRITNNGTISLASTGDQTVAMILPGGVRLAGSGTFTLGTGGPDIIEGLTGKEYLINSSTIQGAGTITNVGLINKGTILANAGTLSIGLPSMGPYRYGFRNQGSLIVDSGSAVNITGPVKLSFKNTGTVMVSSGATLSVGGKSAYTQTRGTTTVDGSLSAANGIYISGGILDGYGGTLTGNLALAGAVLSPGDGKNSAGELRVSGGYSQKSTGALDIDLGGTMWGTFDVLNVSGLASLRGMLNVDALTGFTPAVGEQFDILNYGSKTGTFSTVNCMFSNGDTCSIAYNSTGAVLTIDAPSASAKGHGVARGTLADRKSPNRVTAYSATNMQRPSTVLTQENICGGLRIIASRHCSTNALAGFKENSGSERRAVQSQGTNRSAIYNNAVVATGSGRSGGATHAPTTSNASVLAPAGSSFCAYLPADWARKIGCR